MNASPVILIEDCTLRDISHTLPRNALDQAWWLSWAAPGATGKWFAPQYTDNFCAADLHPAASFSRSALMPTHYPGVDENDIVGHYKPAIPVESLPYSWSHCESVEADAWTGFEKDTACRLGRFVEKCEEELSGSTIVLVTHGGPSVACYHYLTGSPLEGGSGVVPPASFHIFVRETDDDSDSIVATTKRRRTDTAADTSDTDSETSAHTETEPDTPQTDVNTDSWAPTPAPLYTGGGPCYCAWGGWRALVTSYKDVRS